MSYSTTSGLKLKDTTASAVIVLSPDKGVSTGRNNYVEWAAATNDDLGQTYGMMANVLATQIAYQVAQVVPEDYIPIDEPDQPAYTPAQLMTLRLGAHAARSKEVRRLALDKPKFFSAVYARTSVASRLLIEADGDFPAAKAALDPNALIAIIHKTHFTHVDGATAVEARENLEETFGRLRQGPAQNISDFKKEFDTQVRGLEIAGADPMSPEQLALKFLKKLDQVRHGNMFVHLMNGRSAGGAFPESANAAYVIAKDWKSASARVTDSRGVIASGAAFMLADDVRALIIDPVPTPSARRPTIATPARKLSSGVPTRGSARSAMRSKVRFSSPPMMRAAATRRALALDKRACYNCNEVGHLFAQCPHPVLVAVGDEDDEESALYDAAMRRDDATCMMTRSVSVHAVDHELVCFSPTEVILDNAASRSLFENTELLQDIVQSDAPTMIGGVQRGATGIRVDEEGVFRDLGTVGVCIGAAGNILSAGQMVDTGRQVRYDTTKDEYIVSGPASDYVFARRTKEDGTKSRFYTHDFALVATIKENLRRYTSREVKQIEKAEQMMQRLGHMTSAATIGIINSGVQN
jgi:hypothetical protein